MTGLPRALFRRAALAGNPIGMWAFGQLYQMGKGVPRNTGKALAWYRRAAKKGCVGAMYAAGQCCYKLGKSHPGEFAKALTWWKRAAAVSDQACLRSYDGFKSLIARSESMYAIGRMYERGKGVPRNRRVAVKWYRKVVWGLPVGPARRLAAYRLGVMYEHGWGVPKDSLRASQWLESAAAHGYAPAKRAIEKLKDK